MGLNMNAKKWAKELSKHKHMTEATTFSCYACPNCGRNSSFMSLVDKVNVPTKQEEKLFPHTAHEILECECGSKLRWVELIKETYTLREYIYDKLKIEEEGRKGK
jgi:hypothetical protein